MRLGDGGTTGSVAGNIVDNGLVQFNYSGPGRSPDAFSGGGMVEIVAGTAVITGASAIGGTVTIDPGTTMQWGAGGLGFLVGAGNAVVDNGALVMNFGGGGIGGVGPDLRARHPGDPVRLAQRERRQHLHGTTTIELRAFLNLTGAGSISNSSNVIDNGTFDISGTTAGASITTINGAGTSRWARRR